MYYSSVIPQLYQAAMELEAYGYYEFLNLRKRTILSVDESPIDMGLDPAIRQYKVEEIMWKEIFPQGQFPGVLRERAPPPELEGHMNTLQVRLSAAHEAPELHPRQNTDGVRHCALRFPNDPPCSIYFRIEVICWSFQQVDGLPEFPRTVPIPLAYVQDFSEPVHIHTNYENASPLEVSQFRSMVASSTDREKALAVESAWIPRLDDRIPPTRLHNEPTLSERRQQHDQQHRQQQREQQRGQQRGQQRLARRALRTRIALISEYAAPLIQPADSTPTCVICMATVRDPVIVAPCSHRYDHQCLLATIESLSRQVNRQTGELLQRAFKCMHCRQPVQAIFHTFTSGNTAICEQVDFPNVPMMPYAITTFSDGEEEVAAAIPEEEASPVVRWSGEFVGGPMFRMLQAATRAATRNGSN